MHTIRNIDAYQGDSHAGARAFAEQRGICQSPHGSGPRAAAWETGWLNEMQNWLHTIAGINNRAGDLLRDRIDELTAEDQAA